MKARILLASVLVTLVTLPAAGQSIKVSFHGGKVDLQRRERHRAGDPHEWARVGGTRVVNAERIAGPPVTVEFKDAYEQQALESLLRGVSGYIVGQRRCRRATSSGFDRIVILATSNAPRPSPVTPCVSRPPGPQPLRRLPCRSTTRTTRRQRPTAAAARRAAAGDAGGSAPPSRPAARSRRATTTTTGRRPDAPRNPFGVTTGAARPGVITPVPAPRPRNRRARDRAGAATVAG
jgi:hypothetical protein